MKPTASTKTFLGIAISLGWILLVSYHYYNPQTHPSISEARYYLIQLLLIPFLCTVFFLTILGVKKAFNKTAVTSSFSLLEALILLWGLVIFGLIVLGFMRGILTGSDIFPAFASIGFKVIVIQLWLFLLSFTAYCGGKKLLYILNLTPGSIFREALYSIGFGYILLSFGLLGLSLLGQLSGMGLVLLFGLFIAVGYRYASDFMLLLTRRISVSTSLTSSPFWSGWVLFLTLVINFSIMVEPFPSGWDSFTFYFNLARELADAGVYVRGMYTYPVELMYSSGFIAGHLVGLKDFTDMLGVFVAGWGGALGGLSLIALGKQVKNVSTGIVAALIYYSMPLITYFCGWEPKVETTQAFYLVLSLSAYIAWRKSKSVSFAAAIAFFLGFSIIVKITGLFTLFALGLMFIYDVALGCKKGMRNTLLTQLIVVGVGITIIVSPWFGLHLWERNFRITRPADLLTGKDNKLEERGNLLSRVSLEEETTKGFSTAYIEDYGRYEGFETGWWGLEKYLPKTLASIPLARYVTLPWDVVMITNRKDEDMVTTSLFLLILPLLAIAWIGNKKIFSTFKLPKETKVLVIFSLIYFLVWIIWGRGAPWYGMGWLISLSLLVSLFILPLLKVKYISWVMVVLFAANQLLALVLQMNRYIDPSFLQFALGKLDRNCTLEAVFPDHLEMAGIINGDEEIQSGKKFVLRVGTYIPYFIANSRYVLIEDTHFDQFYSLSLTFNHDNQKILRALKEADIKYIIVAANLFYSDTTEEKTLQTKTLRFMDFASKSLILERVNEKMGVLLLKVV